MLVSKPTDPIDFQILYSTISDAASQNPAVVKPASKRLQEYLDHPGTSEQLQSIALEKNNVPLDTRRLAMIQFKNAASSTWKNKRLFNVQAQANIRARALEFIFEEDNTIANCNAYIIAKIARSDVPSQWPSLIPDLTNIIQTRTDLFLTNPTSADPTNTLALKRALQILDEVVEELSSLRLPSGIKTMANICESLYTPLVSYYDRLSSIVQHVISLSNLSSATMQQPCEDLLVIFNMLFSPCVKLMLWLWQKAAQPQFTGVYQTLSAFSQSSFVLFTKLFELRKSLILEVQKSTVPSSTSHISKSITHLTDHILQYGNMFRRMQQLSVKRFMQVPGADDLVLYYWNEIVKASNGPSILIADSLEAVYPVPILVQGMVLFRSNLNAWGNKETQLEKVLPQEFLEEAVRLLLTRFIPLDPEDLEKWSSDPEEWVNEEDKEEDAWEYRLRPCAERVLISLSAQYSQYVIPLLMNTFRHVTSVSSHELSFILQKEAVYCAIGLCSNRLQDELNFDEWMQKNLIPEAQETNPSYRIIKRRIAWVVGRWLTDESRQASTILVWQLLLHLLRDNSSDSVVRLSTAVALTQCLDTVTFNAELFVPFVGDFVTLLTKFLVETEIWESKNKLLKALSMTIERSESQVIPYARVILDPLPGLWQATSSNEGSDNLFKSSLVVMITRLTEACGPHFLTFFSVVNSLLEECFSPQSKIFLEEDGLQLWLSAVRCAPSLTAGDSTNNAGLISLLPRALAYITENLDMLGTLIMIMESYIIADADTILSIYALQLFTAIRSALSMAVKTNTKDLIRLINLIAQLSPAKLWAEALHASGLFACLLKDLIDDKDHYTLLKEYNYAFARMMLCDPNAFNQLVIQSAPALNMPETQAFEGLLDQWWAKFDVIAEPSNRKLVAMGVATWASTGRPEVLDRLYSEIFNLWLDVFGELKEALADETAEESRSPLTTFWRNSKEEPSDLVPIEAEKTLEAARRRQIFLRDPVNNVKLTVFVRENLQQAEAACGGTDIFQSRYLAKADPTVLSQITAALSTGY